MNVEYYTGIDARLEMPMLLPPVPDLVDFERRACSSPTTSQTPGATLALVKEFCEGKVAEVRCAVLYEKPQIDGQLRVRLAPHRPLDHLPVERRGPRSATARAPDHRGLRSSRVGDAASGGDGASESRRGAGAFVFSGERGHGRRQGEARKLALRGV